MYSWLKQQVATNEKGMAIRFSNESYTFSEVYDLVKIQQQKLIPFIKKERRVALIGKNSFEMYLTILALWELHREIVFLNFRLTEKELAYQMNESETNIVIGDTFENNKFPENQFVSFQKIVREEPQKNTNDFILSPTDIASIMFTSGTTGKPKGVLQTFDNHYASASASQTSLNLSREDEWLCVTPIIHISGLSIICRSLILGLTVHLMNCFDEIRVTELLQNSRINLISVVPVMLDKLIKFYPDQGYHQNFKLMLVGGSSIPHTLLEECAKHKISIVQSFGMTETCSQVFALENDLAKEKIGSSGTPLKDVEVLISKKNEHGIGEIWLRGPQVIQNYLKPTDSWSTEGWFKTGDLGYLDQDGFLYVKSRMIELIISGGENIYPAEIEHVFYQNRYVKEIAVIGKEDEVWGQIPVAFVVTNLTFESLNQFGKKELAKFKLPKEWHKVKELPRTTSGKINKSQLMKEINKNE